MTNKNIKRKEKLLKTLNPTLNDDEIVHANDFCGLYYMYYINEDDAKLRRAVALIWIKRISNTLSMEFSLKSYTSVYYGFCLYRRFMVNAGDIVSCITLVGSQEEEHKPEGRVVGDNSATSGLVTFEVHDEKLSPTHFEAESNTIFYEGAMIFRSVGRLDPIRKSSSHVSAKKFILEKLNKIDSYPDGEDIFSDFDKEGHSFEKNFSEISGYERKIYNYLVNSHTRFGALIVGR
ncbi:hypothetical protein [Azospirillum argentinense]|uniref:hypothetical protein n=1 Tax=Azospirillum argentinense TaxID=2970906 RepID=UPI0010BFFDD3|nr:hypothetical protein [Azospirillum argentinense]